MTWILQNQRRVLALIFWPTGREAVERIGLEAMTSNKPIMGVKSMDEKK
jgi:hypothetical protein